MRVKKGYCRCGCGRKTTIAPHNDAKRGYVKGQPRTWIVGHDTSGKFKAQTPKPARVLTMAEVEEIENDGSYKRIRERDLIATVKALAGGAT